MNEISKITVFNFQLRSLFFRCALKIVLLFFYISLSISAQTLSLEDAIAIGLKNNYDVRIARNKNQIAQNNEKMAVGGMLPTAALSGYIGKSYIDSSIAMPWAFEEQSNQTIKSAKASLSWTLFDGFRMFYAYKSLKTSASLNSYLMRDNIENSVVRIVQAYFNLVTQKSLLESAGRQREISHSRLERIKTRRELGAATRVELLNAQVAANADSSGFLTAQLNHLSAVNTLNILLGRKHTTEVSVESEIVLSDVSGPLDQYLKNTQEHNAFMTVMQKSKQLEKYNLGIARAAFLPIVAAQGSYNISTIESMFTKDNTTIEIGLSASWPIFTGFRNSSAYQNSKLTLENSEISEEQYRLKLEALVYQQWETVQNAYRQVGFDETGVELADQHLSLVQEQYEMGKTGGVEFREAQLSVLNANIRLAASKFKARIAATELERMAGKIRIE